MILSFVYKSCSPKFQTATHQKLNKMMRREERTIQTTVLQPVPVTCAPPGDDGFQTRSPTKKRITNGSRIEDHNERLVVRRNSIMTVVIKNGSVKIFMLLPEGRTQRYSDNTVCHPKTETPHYIFIATPYVGHRERRTSNFTRQSDGQQIR